jgi:DNA-binding transcriptional MerR regulator
MPLAKIRQLAELVREGPGNEQERLELLREQRRRIENQLAEREPFRARADRRGSRPRQRAWCIL